MLDTNIGDPDTMRQLQRITQDICLQHARRFPAKARHLLQQNQIGLVMSNHIDNSSEVVAPIDPSDALVYIVSKNPYIHKAVAGLSRLAKFRSV